MGTDWELWTRAVATLDRFGPDAEMEIALQIVRSATTRDDVGVSRWRLIGRYVGDLRRMTAEPERQH